MTDKPPDTAVMTATAVAVHDAAKVVLAEARQVGVTLTMSDARHLVRLAVSTYLAHMAEVGR